MTCSICHSKGHNKKGYTRGGVSNSSASGQTKGMASAQPAGMASAQPARMASAQPTVDTTFEVRVSYAHGDFTITSQVFSIA